MKNRQLYTITVGDLLDALKNYDRSDRLFFGNGDLSLNKVKTYGDKVHIDFNELYRIEDKCQEV